MIGELIRSQELNVWVEFFFLTAGQDQSLVVTVLAVLLALCLMVIAILIFSKD